MLSAEARTVFFVVGASKSGTSSINEYLQQHPDINMVRFKDVACYFCRDYGMPITFEEYKRMLFPDGSYKATGDCCHSYLTDDQSAAWIHSEFPEAKIIIVLRNPADRAFSQYHWLVAHGYEFAETFEQALDLENDRFLRNVRKQKSLIQDYKNNYLYFRSGLYSSQVKRYLDAFPRKNILFLRFDDLKTDSAQAIKSIYSFVEVDADFVPRLQIHNERAEPYSVARQYFIRRQLSRILPERIIVRLLRWNLRRGVQNRFNPETRQQLVSRFAGDIRETAQLTGLDLSAWLS